MRFFLTFQGGFALKPPTHALKADFGFFGFPMRLERVLERNIRMQTLCGLGPRCKDDRSAQLSYLDMEPTHCGIKTIANMTPKDATMGIRGLECLK